ncbi:hypothetical protein H8N01_09260 [Streptomyces sp. AC536]|uniref:hypothetical protein n=1 Tax=Streptomyces buecherae TaxID=2763006 RepID=UPI00164DEA82|nr:hypothetical protein [Streptomyces buecherae]MBC3982748.1 hypothetical protein [Streptomyces buecherae]QNJ41316.1 hypothetical protein H7H31_17015 [Streptomyces buecherae]
MTSRPVCYQARVEIQTPAGDRAIYSGLGLGPEGLAASELQHSAAQAALADAPPGSRVLSTTVRTAELKEIRG